MQITDINANGASSSAAWTGGKGNFTLSGDFGGGSAKIEYESGSNWISIEDESMRGLVIDRERGFNFELQACNIRVYVSNATSTPALVAELEVI